MRKNNICWAIFSDKLMLPFTIRTTRRECITEHLLDKPRHGSYRLKLLSYETCKKIIINEWGKEL